MLFFVFKEAFKLALAMVITYAIALAMDWEKPFWAGLSVAFCSLATSGESIHRSVQRVVGTFLAGAAAIVLVALFPQDRWPFLLSMSALLALLTYWVSGTSRFQQIWFNAGFNIPIVAMLGGGLVASSFDYIVLRVQASVLMLPTVLAALFAGALYVFVMPHLSGFGGLGTMIFAATFLIGYLFHRPQDILLRSMGLCMLVIVIGAENEQTYTFLYPANWVIAGVLFVSALMVAWRFPISFRPADRFLALLGRFFGSMEFLLSSSPFDATDRGSPLFRWRRAFHLHAIAVLPQRLHYWGGALPPAALGDTTRDQIQFLTTNLQTLSDHLQALTEVRPISAKPSILAQELTADMRAWRVGLREAFGRLSADPGTLDQSAAGARLEATLARLEQRVEEALKKADETSVPAEVVNNMYRLLGTYRGVSEALVQVVQETAPIDWARLREARF